MPRSTAVRAVGDAGAQVQVSLAELVRGLRGSRDTLAEAWSGPGSQHHLDHVDALIEHAHSLVHLTGAVAQRSRALADVLSRAEQAERWIGAVEAVNAVATVTAVVQLGLDPVADALSVGLRTSVQLAKEAARRALAGVIRVEVRRAVVQAGLGRFATRWAVGTVAVSGWQVAGELTVGVATGDLTQVRAPDVFGAAGYGVGAALLPVAGRRLVAREVPLPAPSVSVVVRPGRPGFTVPSGTETLVVLPHAVQRHAGVTEQYLVDRVSGRVPRRERSDIAAGFVHEEDLRQLIGEVAVRYASVVEALLSRPGQTQSITVALPMGVPVLGVRLVQGRAVRMSPQELSTVTLVLRSDCHPGTGVFTVKVDHVLLGVSPVTPC
jgi:uncharacterized protein YukE